MQLAHASSFFAIRNGSLKQCAKQVHMAPLSDNSEKSWIQTLHYNLQVSVRLHTAVRTRNTSCHTPGSLLSSIGSICTVTSLCQGYLYIPRPLIRTNFSMLAKQPGTIYILFSRTHGSISFITSKKLLNILNWTLSQLLISNLYILLILRPVLVNFSKGTKFCFIIAIRRSNIWTDFFHKNTLPFFGEG